MDMQEIPKPSIVNSIKMFVDNNYAGTLTGEAFKDLFELISTQEKEIRALKEESLKTMEFHKHNINLQREEIKRLQNKVEFGESPILDLIKEQVAWDKVNKERESK